MNFNLDKDCEHMIEGYCSKQNCLCMYRMITEKDRYGDSKLNMTHEY